jgi:hypothetical protein
MVERSEVLTPTESRQASPRRLNLRVLVGSMILALVAAAVLYYAVYGVPGSPISVPEEPPATQSPPPPAP